MKRNPSDKGRIKRPTVSRKKPRTQEQLLARLERRELRKNAKETANIQTYEEFLQFIKLDLPRRTNWLESVELHLGPTNSGKTYNAIEFLANQGKGTFASPLRMLAQEVYNTLGERLGFSEVGLLTGEEQINPEAPILCTTAEMAPMQGDTLVLDEVHWISDPERGFAWLKLLTGSEYKHLRICGVPQAEKLVRIALAEDIDEIIVHQHPRLSKLSYAGTIKLENIPKRSVLVAFSRKAILALARELSEVKGVSVGVLYGSMPPDTRRLQINNFIKGKVDYMVATDVIGHGINMPCDNIIFSETQKFDGIERRNLYLWEAAQIAGRAGRFRLSTEGKVYGLKPIMNFQIKPEILEEAVEVSVGNKIDSRLNHLKAILSPTLSGLSNPTREELPYALKAWKVKANNLRSKYPWIEVIDISKIQENLTQLGTKYKLSVEDAWVLANAPLDYENIDILTLAKAVSSNQSLNHIVPPNQNVISSMHLEIAETMAKTIRDLRWFHTAFPSKGNLETENLEWAEETLAKRINKLLPQAIEKNTFGKCSSCGKATKVYFAKCDDCFLASRRRYSSWEYGV